MRPHEAKEEQRSLRIGPLQRSHKRQGVSFRVREIEEHVVRQPAKHLELGDGVGGIDDLTRRGKILGILRLAAALALAEQCGRRDEGCKEREAGGGHILSLGSSLIMKRQIRQPPGSRRQTVM